MSIVLLYFFTRKILRLFVPITTQQDFPTSRFSDPWRVHHQAGEYSTVPMIHTFSMWPTLRNTIYLPRITSLGHQHSELSFPATDTLAPILCIVYILPPYDSGALAVIGDERAMVCVRGLVSRGKIFQSLAHVLVVEEVFPFFPRRLQSFFSISRRQLENQFSRPTKNKRKTFCEQFSSVSYLGVWWKLKRSVKLLSQLQKKIKLFKDFLIRATFKDFLWKLFQRFFRIFCVCVCSWLEILKGDFSRVYFQALIRFVSSPLRVLHVSLWVIAYQHQIQAQVGRVWKIFRSSNRFIFRSGDRRRGKSQRKSESLCVTLVKIIRVKIWWASRPSP